MIIQRGEAPIARGDNATIPEGAMMVSPGEWALGSRTYVAVGVSNGIVVAAHNSDTGDGLLGHFAHVAPEGQTAVAQADGAVQTDAFAEAMSMIRRLGPPGSTEVWLGGAADYSSVSTDLEFATEGERQFATRALEKLMLDTAIPIGNLQTSWSGDQEDLIIQLNSRNGVLLVEHIENSP